MHDLLILDVNTETLHMLPKTPAPFTVLVRLVWICFFSIVIPNIYRFLQLYSLCIRNPLFFFVSVWFSSPLLSPLLSSFYLLVWFYDHAPGQRGSPASQVWGQQARWSQEAGSGRFPGMCVFPHSGAITVRAALLLFLSPFCLFWLCGTERRAYLGFNNGRNPL